LEGVMTPILCGRVDYLMAWHGRDLCKEDISFDLSRRHVAALEDVLFSLPRGVACRHLALAPATCRQTR